jgi:hypothetical protein
MAQFYGSPEKKHHDNVDIGLQESEAILPFIVIEFDVEKNTGPWPWLSLGDKVTYAVRKPLKNQANPSAGVELKPWVNTKPTTTMAPKDKPLPALLVDDSLIPTIRGIPEPITDPEPERLGRRGAFKKFFKEL